MPRSAESTRLTSWSLSHRFWAVVWACVQLGMGVGLGLLLLEITLQLNPTLLLRGMAAPAPIEEALTVRQYTVRLSDADLFFWHSRLIHVITEMDNAIEAEVTFHTDEFGFPNQAPAGPSTDVIVLGRSYSLAAQAAHPWPQQMASKTGRSVTNLSQAAIGVDAKHNYLRRFGFAPRTADDLRLAAHSL